MAQSIRLLLGKKDAEAAGTDPETGEAIPVVTGQPFPSDDHRTRFYDEAYEGEYPKALTGRWSTEVFDCPEHIPSCVTGFFCSCITIGQVAEGARLFSGVFYVSIVVLLVDVLVGFGGWLWIMFATYAVAVSRARIAEVYDIPLNPVENWCLSLWCNCCVATQVARHLFAWGKHSSVCEGWSECGPKPASRWPASPTSRQSSYQPGYYAGGSIPPVQEV